ncbi:uncharacterized protein LOC128868578 [Anastrepha ludens]|uniref:uncharacterized protein LOC128868578 n=1 Tax=Anastrepha ludens TaxID=28586 RepID=UPI0023AE776B|nr:uncharacterized protein LOC128868578 [Anastrepha ludens]
MSRQAINLCVSLCLLLLVESLTSIRAETSEESDSEPTPNARDQLLDAITEDYLKVLDYEMIHSKDLFQDVLDDDSLQNTKSEILQGKKMVLKKFVEHVSERKLKKFPPKAHKPARFFHIFSNSLLYREFLDIVARLEPAKSRYDDRIEEALYSNGIENLLKSVNQKRNKLIADSVKRINGYVSGLSAEQRRKAAAQKLSDWSAKMKESEKLQQKMVVLQEFLRYEYLDATPL